MKKFSIIQCKKIVSHKSLYLPRNEKQERYKRLLEQPSPDVVVAIGPAGTSKTMGSSLVGLSKLLNNEVDKLVLSRPAVSVEEQHGYLPGSLTQKMQPWLMPIYDNMNFAINKDEIEHLIHIGKIEICSLAHMRGRSFNKSYIILDECQNCTPNQMLMALTRIGEGSKMVLCGDLNQHDRGFERNGLQDFVHKIKHNDCVDRIELIEFTDQEVIRNPVIPIILEMYK